MARRWWEKAACQGLDSETFFPDEKVRNPANQTAIARMCFDCPVKWECRMEGFAEDNGYWGNTMESFRERRRWPIFGRLFPEAREELDRDTLRKQVRRIAAAIGDSVVDAMHRFGFNQREIDLFLGTSNLDGLAIKAFTRQESAVTNRTWRSRTLEGVGSG